MKIDRLLAITVYLLNHGRASARALADHFGVSVRTIQRDMDSLSQAGIPVWAEAGQRGGYAILEDYKIRNQALKPGDIQMVRTALESLHTAYPKRELGALIEKYSSLELGGPDARISWDFGVTSENAPVQQTIAQLERAIGERRVVRLRYRSAQGSWSERRCEPLAVHYKWYAWYVFAWDLDRRDYRTFKAARISGLAPTAETSAMDHGDIRQRMRASEQAYYAGCSRIEVAFQPSELELMREYFPDCPTSQMDTGALRMVIEVPPSERLWRALLLSFGERVTVIGPPEYRDALIRTARGFLSNYDI